MKRRSPDHENTRWTANKLCLELTLQLNLGTPRASLMVLISEAATVARDAHQLEEVTHG